jgi:hypothetical protein
VTFSAESGLNWPLTFEVASSPVLLPSPDIDGGPGSVAPGTAIYTFASTKVTATPRTVYWAASFTHAPNGCTGPPVTYTTPARALIVLPATSAPTPTPFSLTLLGQPSVGAKGASFMVICQAPAGASCAGEGALEIAVRRRGKHPSIVRLNLGRTSFAVGASQSETLLVAINRTARGLLARSHALRTTLTVKLTNGPSGAPTVVATDTLLIVALNTTRIAQVIERVIATQRHIRARVRCPTVVIQKQGNNFKCIATTYPAKGVRDKTPFDVTQQNDKGDVTFVGE